MQHNADARALCTRTVPLAIVGAAVSTPTAYAMAAPLDGVLGQGTSPTMAFGYGCAVGAVVAGLVVGLVGQRSKRALKSELDEVVAIAERAEEAARRAEASLAEVTPTNQPVSRAVLSVEQDQTRTITTPPVVREETANGESVTNRGVRSLLQERMGSSFFEDLPVIDRGETRSEAEPPFMAAAPRKAELNPRVRAALIDRKVPRFDESLFPDTTYEQESGGDMFEVAMQAMDDSLSATNVLGGDDVHEQPTIDLSRPQENLGDLDPESYIEYLVKDEMERNRSGQARRYSRAHLTMFEGTGDLSAARKMARYRPRHMQVASKDA